MTKAATRIMLTGKNGQLGWELQRALNTLGDVIAFDRSTLDLANHKQLRNTLRDLKPNLIVNAAAYTAVDQAEQEEEMAIAINATAPEIMAAEARALGAGLVHYSTDYVFDGSATSAYTEIAQTNPINVYGKSKLLGEQAIEETGIPYFIFRTSWVYAARGKNFLLTMLKLMQERNKLSIVNDQHGTPTWSRMIAEVTGQVLSRINNKEGLDLDEMNRLSDLYHLTSTGRTTWYDFATEIQKISSEFIPIKNGLKISGIPSSEYPVPAKRPMNSELSTQKLSDSFGIRCPDWKTSLDLCIQELSINSH